MYLNFQHLGIFVFRCILGTTRKQNTVGERGQRIKETDHSLPIQIPHRQPKFRPQRTSKNCYSLNDTYHRNVTCPLLRKLCSQVHTTAIRTVRTGQHIHGLCYGHDKQAAELKEWVRSQKSSTKQKPRETIWWNQMPSSSVSEDGDRVFTYIKWK